MKLIDIWLGIQQRVSPQVTHGFVSLREAGFSQDVNSLLCPRHDEGGREKKKGSNNQEVSEVSGSGAAGLSSSNMNNHQQQEGRDESVALHLSNPGCCDRKKKSDMSIIFDISLRNI